MSLLAERGAGPDPARQRPRVEPLGEANRAELLALTDADPLVTVVAGARLRSPRPLTPGTTPSLLGARCGDGTLRAAAVDVGNLMPVGGGSVEWAELAHRVRQAPRACSSIVGRADAVAAFWRVLQPAWGPARAIRAAQPLLAVGREHAPAGGDPRLRLMRLTDLDAYLPAAEAMFVEELGTAPGHAAGRGQYRARVAGLIAARRALGVVEGGRVVFKADLGAVTPHTCQIQGVWVHPLYRGRGLATAAMAGVLRHALQLAPTASLYVNDYNIPARRLYARLGMTEVAVLSTILF